MTTLNDVAGFVADVCMEHRSVTPSLLCYYASSIDLDPFDMTFDVIKGLAEPSIHHQYHQRKWDPRWERISMDAAKRIMRHNSTRRDGRRRIG